MKRLFVSLLFLVLASICFGQDLKNSSEWTKLIDYICSRYAQTYCEKRCGEDDLSQSSIDKYNNGIKQNLDGKKLGEAVGRQELKDIMLNNGWPKAYNDVVARLQTKYDQDPTSRTLDSALDLSVLEKDRIKYLEGMKESLKRELEERYAPAPPKVEAPKTQSGDSKDDSRQRSSSFGWKLLSLLEMLLLIGLIVFMLNRTSEERIKSIVYNSGRLEEKYVQKGDLDGLVSKKDIKKQFESLESDIQRIKESVPKQSQNVEYRQQKVVEVPVPPQPTYAPVFVKNFGGGLLRVVDLESEAQFRLDLVNESTANFSFCGDVSRALANSDGTFDYVCDQEGSVSDAKEIQTATPGSATKQVDGKWLVTVKAKIVFV